MEFQTVLFLFFIINHKKKRTISDSLSLYPDPGSNRDGLPHWCLRPARLPIPPSGHSFLNCECKSIWNFDDMQAFLRKFFINVHNILILRVVIRRGDPCGRPRLIGRLSMICLVVALIPWATTRVALQNTVYYLYLRRKF